MQPPPLHYRPHYRCDSRRGFTLSEIAIVLGVAGILIGAIWAAASSVNEGTKINKAVEELQTVSQNMIVLYQNRTLPAGCDNTYGPNMTDAAIAAGIIPSWAISQTAPCKTASNPWSGDFVVWTHAAGPLGPPNTFRISFYNVPLASCIALLLQGTNCDPNQPGCPYSVFTNTGLIPFTDNNAGPPSNWQNMTPEKAADATLCGANTAAANSVEFNYRL